MTNASTCLLRVPAGQTAGLVQTLRDKGIFVEAELLPAKVNISRDDFDTVCAALKDAGIGYIVESAN